MRPIYLDNAATTFPKPKVVTEAVAQCISDCAVSPLRGSGALINRANNVLIECRSALAEEFAVSPDQVAFVPSATFAINTVLRGFPFSPGDVVYSSPFEHNAVSRCLHYLNKAGGIRWKKLPIDVEGHTDELDLLHEFSIEPPALVVVAHASNVTGDLLPVSSIARLAHQYGGRVLLDAAQTVGTYTPSRTDVEFDFAAFSSHKGLYGIQGAGGLVFGHSSRSNLIEPLVYGGTGTRSEELDQPDDMPERFESGTHSLPAIVSMNEGLKWIRRTGRSVIGGKTAYLSDFLETQLRSIPGVRIHGRRHPTTNTGIVSFEVHSSTPQDVGRYLSSREIYIRAGLHCAPLAHQALGTLPHGTVRVSPGFFNSEDDMVELVDAIRGYLSR